MISRKSSSASTSGEAWIADAWSGPTLLLRLSSLGDVVLATAAARLLHDRRPDLPIDVLTRRAYAPVWERAPGIREILVAEEAAAGEYRRVLDLQGGPKGRRAAARFAPGARRIGYERAAWRRRWVVVWGRRAGGVEPLAVRFARALSGRTLRTVDVWPRVIPDPERQGMLAPELGDARWVVLAPGASRRLKAIPEPLVRSVTDRLLASGRGVIRLLEPGGPNGFVAGRGAERAYRGSLGDVTALLSLAEGVIASDSGILHLATAVGKPAVGVFGPTAPELGFSPLGRGRAIGVDLPCRPCHVHGPHRCWQGHERCWREMSATRIVEGWEESLTHG